MKRNLSLLALAVLMLVRAAPVAAQDGFYVIAGGRAGTQINSLPYTINANAPGLYCLARNLTYTSTTGDAITVNASNVTLDLMGFCLTGPGKSSGTNNGIKISIGCANVEVRNGSIQTFGQYGVNTDYAAGQTADDARIIGLRIQNTGNAGIWLRGANSLVMGCSVLSAGGNGIDVGGHTLVKGNHAYNNSSGYGIFAGSGCTVAGNTANKNQTGIATGDGSLVMDNTAYMNSSSGIAAGSYCTLMRNSVYLNAYKAISAGDYCSISNNAGNNGMIYGTTTCALENNAIQP